MTSYTRKLHSKDPSKAVAIHRLRYGKHTTLTQFSLHDEVQALVKPSRAVAHIEQDFDVTERLQRWADRGWR